MAFLRWIFIVSVIGCIQGFHTSKKDENSEPRYCVFFDDGESQKNPHPQKNHVTSNEDSEDYITSITEESNGLWKQECSKNIHFCYTAITINPNTNETEIIKQGCWGSAGDCDKPTCVPQKKHRNPVLKTEFCCCTGNFCNRNITQSDGPFDGSEDGEPYRDQFRENPAEDGGLVIMWAGGLVMLGVTVLVLLALYCSCRSNIRRIQKPDPDAVRLMENGRGPGFGYGQIMGRFTGDQINFLNVVGQGRYGSVWRASIADQDVAVKVFPAHYRNYFLNEKDIYCLPFMADCPSLLQYYGCDERTNEDGSVEYLLVLSYSPKGSLQEYLRSNTLDWSTFCRMSLSVAKGLAHLHTDFHKGDKIKPCVSHRDFNTLNILVNADLTCSVCDLGFSMKITGSKYYQNGEEQHAEAKSINDVGTLRYMAPEVLEGAVNLRDCESSLKQIDVYALGLVLWELSTRCRDIYHPGTEIPPYRLPFEAEIGRNPSFEQMQVFVVRHKARPLFPVTWKDWAAIRLLRETMDDCWDQDAEARLTSLCVEERLSELPTLWDRQRSTIYSSGLSPTLNVVQTTSPNCSIINNNTTSSFGCTAVEGVRNFYGDSTDDTVRSSGSRKDAQDWTTSEGTGETLLTLSPSESHEPIFNNGWSRGPLQPFQGRNPCMERNLMPTAAIEEELEKQTANLVDRSSKHAPQGQYQLSNTDTQSLVTHDFLGHHQLPPAQQSNISNIRAANPIPYVQNVVYNSHHNHQSISKPIPDSTKEEKSGLFSGWHIGGGIRKLLDSKKKSVSKVKDDIVRIVVGKEQQPEEDEGKSNLLLGCDTQVSLLPKKNSSVVTTVFNADNSSSKSEDSSEGLRPSLSSPLRPTTLSLPSVNDCHTEDKRSRNIRKRMSADCQNMFSSSSSGGWKLKDPQLHIKTPGDVPASVRKNRGRGFATRFSLYDDRMMTIGNQSRIGDLSELESDGVIEVSVSNVAPHKMNVGQQSTDDSIF